MASGPQRIPEQTMDFIGNARDGPEVYRLRRGDETHQIGHPLFPRIAYGSTATQYFTHQRSQKWRTFGHKKSRKSNSTTPILNFSSPQINITAIDCCLNSSHHQQPLEDAASVSLNGHRPNSPRTALGKPELQVSSLLLLFNMVLPKNIISRE